MILSEVIYPILIKAISQVCQPEVCLVWLLPLFSLACLEISQLESEMNIGSSDDIFKNIPLSYEDLEGNSMYGMYACMHACMYV